MNSRTNRSPHCDPGAVTRVGAGIRASSLRRRAWLVWVTLSCALVAASSTAAGGQPAAQALQTEGGWGFESYIDFYTGSFATAVAAGDVNSDGWTDTLITTTYSGYQDQIERNHRLWIYLGRSDGSLLEEPIGLRTSADDLTPVTVATGDFNGDGYTDAAVGSVNGVDIFTQQDHTLTRVRPLNIPTARGVEAADVNGDGFTDLVAWSNYGVEVWWQKDGHLVRSSVQRRATADQLYEVEVSDATGDGLVDIVGFYPGVRVYAQKQDHRFKPPTIYPLPEMDTGIAVGDLNGDGRNDVTVSIPRNLPNAGIHLFLQQSDGSLEPAPQLDAYHIPKTAEIADVTGDGRQDLVVLHSGWHYAAIYEQALDGSLNTPQYVNLPDGSHLKGLVLEDISGDGMRDLVVADHNEGLAIARATGTPPPLDTTVASGPLGALRNTSAVFALSANRGGAAFECSLDAQPFTPCETPVTYTSLAPGSAHNFSARAVVVGQTDSTPVARAFRVAKAADAHIWLWASSTRVNHGGHIKLVARVVNDGPHEARRARVVFQPPDGLKLDQVLSGRCFHLTNPRRWSCPVGDLAAQSSARVEIRVIVKASQSSVVVTAAARSRTWDQNPDNDASLVTIRVH